MRRINSGERTRKYFKTRFSLGKHLLAGGELGYTEAHFEVPAQARHYLMGLVTSCPWALISSSEIQGACEVPGENGVDLQVLHVLLNPALTLGFVFSWTRIPMATGAKGTWPQEVSGSPGPQLPPWGVFLPLPTAKILTARKNGFLLCLVQNHSLRSNCLGSLLHETYPTASGTGGGGQ